ncbi:M48 family metalloprotease [candidate division KSB1 bacterium]|nr:M48 family metalloprotease [candidate division KSB1 bacterium]
MKKIAIYSTAVLSLALLAWIISCAINPVTGKRELMLLSENDEVALGQQTDQQIIETYGIYQDAQLNSYINQLGQRMAKITHRPQLNYHFKVLDTPVINAFAVPGGYVYFTRGILAFLNDEAEFAGVMGHELGHVNARHSAQQYSKIQLAQLGLGIGMVLSEDFRKYAGLAQFGVQLLFLKFSRDNERQADDLGVEYSSKVGYDANRMADFFETLERLSGGSAQSGLPDWFSTHPNPVDRIGAVKRKTAQMQAQLPGTQFTVNRDTYLRTIDGILFGEDPQQGYVEGNTFYHPSLRFSFTVPQGWTLNNTPKQVQMVSPQQDAFILFALESGGSPQAAAQNFRQSSGAMVRSSDALTINGMAAQRMLSEVPTEQDTLAVLSYFIQKGGNIFLFHGASTPEKYSAYQGHLAATPTQFRSLTDSRYINVKPNHLKVRNVTSTNTFSNILRQWGVPGDQVEEVAIMNGIKSTDQVAVGTLLKVVVK